MIATVRCRKCGEIGKFDVGDASTIGEAQSRMDGYTGEHCPFGRHMELSPIRYEVIGLEDGAAPTDGEWAARMRAGGYDLWTTDELRGTEIEITAFAFGDPVAMVRGRVFWLRSATSPGGHRYYYSHAGDYDRAIS